MNLFLASYRFDKALIRVYRYAVLFFIVLLMVVLLITFLPALTIGVRASGAWSS
jgi:TRAP-type C4-dicarboxylate transport system permease large subunit